MEPDIGYHATITVYRVPTHDPYWLGTLYTTDAPEHQDRQILRLSNDRYRHRTFTVNVAGHLTDDPRRPRCLPLTGALTARQPGDAGVPHAEQLLTLGDTLVVIVHDGTVPQAEHLAEIRDGADGPRLVFLGENTPPHRRMDCPGTDRIIANPGYAADGLQAAPCPECDQPAVYVATHARERHLPERVTRLVPHTTVRSG